MTLGKLELGRGAFGNGNIGLSVYSVHMRGRGNG